VRDIVRVKCGQCGTVDCKTFKCVINATNTHLRYSGFYLCPKCFRNHPKYIEECRARSILAKSKITYGSSERSKKLWRNDDYRAKMRVNHANLSKSSEFKLKVSESIAKKFRDDSYVAKVKKARKSYWDDKKYRESRLLSLDDFIEASNKVHGNKYDYSLVNYVNSKTKVIIICSKHGQFSQRPSHHVHYANGCPNCREDISRPQLEIKTWLYSLGFDVIDNDRSVLSGLELDIYVPAKRIAIEYNGGFWHSFDRLETTAQRKKHHNKASAAEDNNIVLLQVLDNEWNMRADIVKSMIQSRLGLSERIYARRCKMVVLSSDEARHFFNINHLCGNRNASFHYGLVCDNVIIAAISISKNGCGHELIRFANVIGHTVIGGLSKLICNAARELGIERLLSYADRRYSHLARGYTSCGFFHCGITKPGYMYWRNNRYYSRLKFQKHKLAGVLTKFDQSKTESENMFLNGYRRIWDAGHHRMIKYFNED